MPCGLELFYVWGRYTLLFFYVISVFAYRRMSINAITNFFHLKRATVPCILDTESEICLCVRNIFAGKVWPNCIRAERFCGIRFECIKVIAFCILSFYRYSRWGIPFALEQRNHHAPQAQHTAFTRNIFAAKEAQGKIGACIIQRKVNW